MALAHKEMAAFFPATGINSLSHCSVLVGLDRAGRGMQSFMAKHL